MLYVFKISFVHDNSKIICCWQYAFIVVIQNVWLLSWGELGLIGRHGVWQWHICLILMTRNKARCLFFSSVVGCRIWISHFRIHLPYISHNIKQGNCKWYVNFVDRHWIYKMWLLFVKSWNTFSLKNERSKLLLLHSWDRVCVTLLVVVCLHALLVAHLDMYREANGAGENRANTLDFTLCLFQNDGISCWQWCGNICQE